MAQTSTTRFGGAGAAVAQVAAQGVFALTLDFTNLVNQALIESARIPARQTLVMAQYMNDRLSDHNIMLRQYERVAERGHQQLIASYLIARSASTAKSGPYRVTGVTNSKNKRYADGALLAALRQNSMAVASPDGINYVDVQYLDKVAKQWHRLNFGAGAAPGKGTAAFGVTFGALALASLGLASAPSKGFTLPAGLWVKRGATPGNLTPDTVGVDVGGDFYPYSELTAQERVAFRRFVRRSSKILSIRAEHWIESGLQVMLEELPVAFNNAIRDLFREGAAQGRARTISGTVTPTFSKGFRGIYNWGG